MKIRNDKCQINSFSSCAGILFGPGDAKYICDNCNRYACERCTVELKLRDKTTADHTIPYSICHPCADKIFKAHLASSIVPMVQQDRIPFSEQKINTRERNWIERLFGSRKSDN